LDDVSASESFGWEIQSTYRVTSDSQWDRQPCMIQDNSGGFITFFTSYSEGTYNIRSSVSDDGVAWSRPTAITSETNPTQGNLGPSAIKDHNGVYWLSYYKESSGIWIAGSSDGVNWNTFTQVTYYDYQSSSWCRQPSLIQDKNGKYWLAYESSIHRSDILVQGSSDGVNWDTQVQVTPGTETELSPCLMQDASGTYWLVWCRLDGTIWISSSKDGVNWDQQRQIETEMTAFNPQLAQDSNGNYVIAWLDSNVARQGRAWITSSQDCLNWRSPQQIIVGIDFFHLMQDVNGKYHLIFTSDNQGDDDIWMMTLSQGNVRSPPWPSLPEGGLSVRYTNITEIHDDKLKVTWATRDTSGWSGHQVKLKIWSCKLPINEENPWTLIAEWNLGAVGSGNGYSSMQTITGLVTQYGSPVRNEERTHPIDGTANYWIWESDIIGNFSELLLPDYDIQFAAEVDQSPIVYYGDLPYYGQTQTGDYYRSSNPTSPTSSASPQERNILTITTNSSVSALSFDSQKKELSFNVEGPSETTGYINVSILKSLLSDVSGLKIYLDGNQLDYTYESKGDSWIICFTYSHSTHRVTINLQSSTLDENQIGQILVFALPIAVIILFFVVTRLKDRKTKTSE
jgi:hypothetical protein